MFSVIGDVFSSMILWIGWVLFEMLFYWVHVPDHSGHMAPLLEFFLIGVCASILFLSIKLLRRASSHGR